MYSLAIKHALVGAALCLTAGTLPAVDLDRLTFITEDYPPYNYERGGELRGQSVQVLEAMLDESGSEQTLDDVRVLPWARGYETTLHEPNAVLFSTTRTKNRENLFNWVGPLAADRVVLLARRDAGIDIQTIDALRESDYQIVVIQEDIGAQRLEEAGVDSDQVRTAIDNVSALNMLAAGRVDLWAYDEEVAHWLMGEHGIDYRQFESVYTLSEAYLYFAVNPETDPALVNGMQSLLDRLRDEGAVRPVRRWQ